MYCHIFIFLIYFWTTPLWAMPADTEELLPEIHLIIEQPKTDEYSLAHPIDLQDKILHLLQHQAEQKTSLLEFLGKFSHRDLKQLYENLYSLLQVIENNQSIQATTLANVMQFDARGNPILTDLVTRLVENFSCQHTRQNIILPKTWQAPPLIPNRMGREVIAHQRNDNDAQYCDGDCNCIWCFFNAGFCLCTISQFMLGVPSVSCIFCVAGSCSCLVQCGVFCLTSRAQR